MKSSICRLIKPRVAQQSKVAAASQFLICIWRKASFSGLKGIFSVSDRTDVFCSRVFLRCSQSHCDYCIVVLMAFYALQTASTPTPFSCRHIPFLPKHRLMMSFSIWRCSSSEVEPVCVAIISCLGCRCLAVLVV